VKQCVLPVAGLGTRMYPASRAFPKALFPVIDQDGSARPLLHLLISQAVDAGIERVGVVAHSEQLPLLRDYFEKAAPTAVRTSAALAAEADRIRALSSQIEWIVQTEPLGFGDAVLQAKPFTGTQPFLVLLGDHLYRSTQEASCMVQALDAFGAGNQSIMGCAWAEPDELERIAAVCLRPGQAVDSLGEGSILDVDEVQEKPGPDWVHQHPESLLHGKALGAFGLDVFTEDLMVVLERMSQQMRSTGKELQLREAQNRLAKEGHLSALVMTGNRYDLGEPELYAMHLAVLAPFERVERLHMAFHRR